MKQMGWMLLGALWLAPLAGAQNNAPPRTDIAPNALRDAALTVAQAVDAGQAAQLWQSASAVTRGALQQQQFVASVAQARKPFGQPLQRQWTGITLRDVGSAQGTVKPGRYGSVDFGTTFAGNRRAHELVSFRLDEDGQWRFAGYVIEGVR
ncbi:MAG TPA: DUF4019 domain-containing protein [Stenotrophomonas sp.]|jgi:hypothetical protein